MNKIFSEICREQNEAFYEAERRRHLRMRQLKTWGEYIGAAFCVASIYALIILLFSL